LRKLTFVKNAFILTVTSLILKFLGIVLRVYMSNKIGAEGMGLYQLIFSIYILASTFATAGITTAVIRLVAEELIKNNKSAAIKILHKSIGIAIILGLLSSIFISFFAEPIGKYMLNDVRTIPAIKILVLVFPFMSISSCIKGYFIARKSVITPSKAQVFEQIIRIGMIFILLNNFAQYGVTVACTVVIISDITAEILSCIYSYICYLNDRKNLNNSFIGKKSTPKILKTFFSIALPIAANRYVNTILHTIENILVPNSLRQHNGSQEIGLSQFGMLKGMAIPLIFFPSSFLNAISTLLIPEMTEANSLNQSTKIKKVVEKTLHITIVSSILIAGIFFLFSYELSELIYKNADVGFIIKMLAPLIPFMYLESVVAGILQGLNQQLSSLKYILFDSLIRICLVYFFVPTKGLTGFLVIMIISNLTTSCLNLNRLLKVTQVKVHWNKWIIKPLISLSIASFALLKILPYIPSSIITYVVSGIFIVSLVYIIILFLTKSVTLDDLFLKNKKHTRHQQA